MSIRQDIATALTATALTKCHEFKPSAPKTGQSWVQSGVDSRVAGVWEESLVVYLVLSQNLAKADQWRDEHKATIVDAIEEADTGYVDEISPIVNLGSESNPLYGVTLELRS